MKLRFALYGFLASSVAALTPVTTAHAQAPGDSALLNALVKKGVLSDQEAEGIKAQDEKEWSTTAASKFSILSNVTNLKIYGDARLRFEYLDEKPQNQTQAVVGNGQTGQNSATTDRSRYRLRVGADYTFTDNFKAGVELESASGADTANQSFGSEFGKFPIYVGLVYLQWKPVDFLTLTGGKQKNPIYTTDLMWDPDINPEGGSEVANWTFPVDFGSDSAPVRDPKDMKAMKSSAASNMSFSVGLTAAQFDYSDANEYANPVPSNTPKTDIWMFVEQVPVQFNFNKDTFIKEVPGFTSYMGGGTNTAEGIGTQDAFASNNAADNLQIFTAPGEVDWKMWNLPFKAYWDFALNTEAKERIQGVYLASNGNGTNATQAQNRDLGDNTAWLAGLQVGQNKKKGDWSFKGDFRQIGLGAVDPNINDSDFGESFLNQQGIRLQSAYNFTDFVTGSLTFFDTWALKDNLMNGSAGNVATTVPLGGGHGGVLGNTGPNASLVGIHSSQRVQVDLMWKF